MPWLFDLLGFVKQEAIAITCHGKYLLDLVQQSNIMDHVQRSRDKDNPALRAMVTSCDEWLVNTLRPRQNGRHFADNILKSIVLNEKAWIQINISLK